VVEVKVFSATKRKDRDRLDEVGHSLVERPSGLRPSDCPSDAVVGSGIPLPVHHVHGLAEDLAASAWALEQQGGGVVTEVAAVTVAVSVTRTEAVGPAFGGPGPGRNQDGLAARDGEDGIEKGQGGRDSRLIHVTPGHGHGQMGADLPSRAGCDPVVMKSILAHASGPFGDVAGH